MAIPKEEYIELLEREYPLFCYVGQLLLKGELPLASLDENGKTDRDKKGEVVPTRAAFIAVFLEEQYQESLDDYWDYLQLVRGD